MRSNLFSKIGLRALLLVLLFGLAGTACIVATEPAPRHGHVVRRPAPGHHHHAPKKHKKYKKHQKHKKHKH
jgi:hypothetical protein